MSSATHLDPASAFLASMPPRYRELFDTTSAREHAAIVERRDNRPVHVELWRRLPRGRAIACVVADDRPGLLSFIGTALIVQGLDVEAAQAFTRDTGEAVDLFCLRGDASRKSAVQEADVERVAAMLCDLVTDKTTLDEVSGLARVQSANPPIKDTKVTFEEADRDGVSVLTVQTFDRPGLLLAVTRALYRSNVQIIASDAMTERGAVVDRFSIVELDGTALLPDRRRRLQVEVLAAIDTTWHGRARDKA